MKVWRLADGTCQVRDLHERRTALANDSIKLEDAKPAGNSRASGESGGSNPTVTSLQDLTTNAFAGTLNNFNLNGQTSNWICSDVSLPTSLKESFQVEYLNIFPNPTSGNINIIIEDEGQVTVQFFDLSGRLILQRNNQSSTSPIELDDIANGLYFVFLTGNGKKYMGKVVVHRGQ